MGLIILVYDDYIEGTLRSNIGNHPAPSFKTEPAEWFEEGLKLTDRPPKPRRTGLFNCLGLLFLISLYKSLIKGSLFGGPASV